MKGKSKPEGKVPKEKCKMQNAKWGKSGQKAAATSLPEIAPGRVDLVARASSASSPWCWSSDTIIHSFPPIQTPAARVLILGTMPGVASLRAQQYYAHPQNAFWKIIGTILGCDPASPYAARTSALSAAGIALWDVLKSCVREGSLDSDIDSGTIIPNDFPAFFTAHPHIGRIFFNGAHAEALFLRHVRPLLAGRPEIPHIRLPSTSPANASIPFAEKVRAWRAVVSRD